jgi:MFS family permease
LRHTFRSLRNPNYRIWAAGALVSNIGTWMQRTAQDWIVLTELTDRNATSMGIVMGLQFGPQLLMLPLTGYAADHFNRRKLLFCTQAAMGLLALGLGLLTVTGLVRLWHVYIFAFLLGCAAAFDAPARQTFVAELVEERDLPNAVGLNSTSFNAARMFGPALAGLLISAVGSGWVFLINAVSFLAVLGALVALRPHRLRPTQRAAHTPGSFAEGFRYVLRRSDLKLILFMLFVISTFGLNFSIFISTMAVKVFGAGASQYGLLTSMLAAGSVTGALMTAARAKPGIPDDDNQHPGADFDRTRDAGPRHRDPDGDHIRGHTDRFSDRRLDRRPFWPALGARRRRIVRTDRRIGSGNLSLESRAGRDERGARLKSSFRAG